MSTSTRIVKIIVKNTELTKVFNEFSTIMPENEKASVDIHAINGNFTVELRVFDNKTTYTMLATNENIVDWEFIEEPPRFIDYIPMCEREKIEQIDYKPRLLELPDNPSYKDKVENTVPGDDIWNKITTFIDLATLIEAVWKLKIDDTLDFDGILFNSKLSSTFDSLKNDRYTLADRAVLNIVLQSYYADKDFTIARSDAKTKIRQQWVSKQILTYETFTQLIEKTFKN